MVRWKRARLDVSYSGHLPMAVKIARSYGAYTLDYRPPQEDHGQDPVVPEVVEESSESESEHDSEHDSESERSEGEGENENENEDENSDSEPNTQQDQEQDQEQQAPVVTTTGTGTSTSTSTGTGTGTILGRKRAKGPGTRGLFLKNVLYRAGDRKEDEDLLLLVLRNNNVPTKKIFDVWFSASGRTEAAVQQRYGVLKNKISEMGCRDPGDVVALNKELERFQKERFPNGIIAVPSQGLNSKKRKASSVALSGSEDKKKKAYNSDDDGDKEDVCGDHENRDKDLDDGYDADDEK